MSRHTSGPSKAPAIKEAPEQVKTLARAYADSDPYLVVAAPEMRAFVAKIARLSDGEVGNPALLLRILADDARALVAKAEGSA